PIEVVATIFWEQIPNGKHLCFKITEPQKIKAHPEGTRLLLLSFRLSSGPKTDSIWRTSVC
ncbi:MAG TPA: hypothetical protein VHW43_11880, partial [Puia sp.]|nr:hypothetical protein [Puia sp.]